MLDKNNQRMLAYSERILKIMPIEGADNIELVQINGWTCIAKKGEFKEGDLCIYFEIDSKLPETEWSEFLRNKNFKVKTMKLGKFKVISQGLALPYSAFSGVDLPADIHEDMTTKLGVTYAVEEDNQRKANSPDKYKKMCQRHPKIFKQKWARWLMKREWGKKILFLFFGRKKDKAKGFPTHFQYIKRSDEERIENMPYILSDKSPWIKTLKVDGTSSTYIIERKSFGKFEYYVLSRNVRQLKEEQNCYHDFNVYWYNSNKYKIKEFLIAEMKKHPEWSYCCIQGESAGGNELGAIQGNPHKLDNIYFYGFNFIDSINGRWNSVEAKKLCDQYGIPWVPIIDDYYILPDTMEEFKLTADGKCELPNSSGLREGYVYRSLDGKRSFKNISREYLMKH